MDGYLAGSGGRQVGTAAGEDADREAGRKDSQRNSGKKGEAGRQTDTCVLVRAQSVPERCCWAAAISVLRLSCSAARRIVGPRPSTDSKTLRREATARNLPCGFACGSLKGVMHKDHAAWTQQENRDNMEKQPRYSRSSTESNYRDCRTHDPWCQPVSICIAVTRVRVSMSTNVQRDGSSARQ